METLKQQVRRAHRRLVLQLFLRSVSWCWFGALLVAAALIGIGKYWPLGVEDWQLAVGGLIAGFLVATVYTVIRRAPALDAAIELDKRFGLKERVSSTLALSADELETPAGKALQADALKRIERIHVAERFGVSLDRWSWLPLVPAALAFVLAVFVAPNSRENTVEAKEDIVAVRKQVKESSEALRKQLEERKKEAREKGLKDAEQLFEKIERGAKDLSKQGVDRKQALVSLNDLAKELEKRRAELGDGEKLKQQLNNLKDLQEGPADKLAEALKSGDINKASKEIEQLKQQLKQGKLDKQAQEKLGNQMAEMKQKLEQAIKEQQQQQEELKQRIEQKLAEGKKAEAEELQQQLQQMEKQQAQMQQLQKMAEKMGQCAQCMKEGSQEEAEAALSELQADLQSLQQQLEEMEMLDQAMDEISQAKGGMGRGKGMRDGPPGFGLGEGQGQGDRPEERTDVKLRDSLVKQQVGKGAAVMTGLTEGPNQRGQVEQEVKTQFESAKTEAADPLTDQRLPREYRDHAKKYFDAIREGQR